MDNEIKRLVTEMTNIEGALASLYVNFDALVLKCKDNENEKNRVNAINRDKIGAYIQDIQTLNADLNIVRNIGESDEEFAQRLAGLSEELTTPGEEEEAIKRKNFLRMKSNLGKLISDTAKAEATVKLFSPEEQFEYNKREPVVNKKFLEVYGFNNKRINENEIAEFIKNMINENPITLISNAKAPLTSTKAPATLRRGPPPSPIPLAAAVPIPDTAGERLRKYIIEDYGADIPSGATNSMVLDEYARLNIEIPDDIAKKLKNKKDRKKAWNINDAIKAASRGVGSGPPMSPPEPPISGVGVKEYPKLVQFGKIYISADELYYKNILKIRNYKKHAIVGIPNVKVSEDLATILLKIIDGGKISKVI